MIAVFLLQCRSVSFSHGCKRKTKPAAERKETSPGSRGGRGEGTGGNKKYRDYFPALSAANPPFTSHKKTFDAFQWLNLALLVPPTRSGFTQSHTTRRRAHTHSQAHSVHSACQKSALRWRRGLSSVSPPSPLSSLSSILHGPALLWGPHRGFCVDRWPVASLEVGLHRVHPYLVVTDFQGQREGSLCVTKRLDSPVILNL